MHELVNRQTGASILAVFVCSTLVWLLLGTPSSGISEADVFLVYARNFVNGHGMVYNVGIEPLGGVPSLLWMWICSFFYMMGDAVEVPLFLLNLVFGIITVYVCLQRCVQKAIFLLLLCSAPAWFAWCQLTLEDSGLWCLLLTVSVLAVSEQRTSLCIGLLPLLALTRPESMLWGCWLMLVLFLELALDRGWRAGLRAIFRPAFAFGIVCAALVRFRIHYFGSLFSESVGSDGSQGLEINFGAGIYYLLGYLFSNPVVLLVVLVFTGACIREIIRKRGLSRPLAVGLCLLPCLGIPLLAGDEPFRGFRLYQPIWPLLCLVSAWAMPLFSGRLKRLSRRLIPVALLLMAWMIFAGSDHLRREFRMARTGREQGAVLARMFDEHTPPPRVAMMLSGGFKQAYPGTVYDLKALAVVDRDPLPAGKRRANNGSPFDRAMFHEWHPDILIQNGSEGFEQGVFQGLLSERTFRERYIKGELWYHDEIFFAYFSRQFINGLKDGYYAFNQDLQYALSMEDWENISGPWPAEVLEQVIPVD